MFNLKKATAAILATTMMAGFSIQNISDMSIFTADAYEAGYHYCDYSYSTNTWFTPTFNSSNRVLKWPLSTSDNRNLYIRSSFWDERDHGAIDIDSYYGCPVLASAAGQIVEVGGDDGWGGGYGYYVKIKHNINGTIVYTQYSHMSSIYKRSGTVTQGEKIGYVGATGQVEGTHLDFQVMTVQSPSNRMTQNYDPCRVVALPSSIKMVAGNPWEVGPWLNDVTKTDYCPSNLKNGGGLPAGWFSPDSMTGKNYSDAVVSNFALNSSANSMKQVPIGSPTYGIRKKNTSTSVYFKLTNMSNVTGGVRVATYGLSGLGWGNSKYNETLNGSNSRVSYVVVNNYNGYYIHNLINEDRYAYAGIQLGSGNTANGKKVSFRWSPDSI